MKEEIPDGISSFIKKGIKILVIILVLSGHVMLSPCCDDKKTLCRYGLLFLDFPNSRTLRNEIIFFAKYPCGIVL
jgi:hypothetical protein